MKPAKTIAFVTGAAAGLGLAIAERLARDGMTVIAADIARSSSNGNDAIIPMVLDAADEASVSAAIADIDQRFGRLDILVNNAGVAGIRVPVASMPLDDWERTIAINLTGTFLVTRAALPFLKRSRRGRIVMVASQAARGRTGTGKAQYAASKAGMVAFARVLADEVGGDGITVNCVAPSRTMSALTLAKAAEDPDYFAAGISQTALGRLAEPKDTAAAVAFLCSEEAAFLTGAIIDVTGGAYMP